MRESNRGNSNFSMNSSTSAMPSTYSSLSSSKPSAGSFFDRNSSPAFFKQTSVDSFGGVSSNGGLHGGTSTWWGQTPSRRPQNMEQSLSAQFAENPREAPPRLQGSLSMPNLTPYSKGKGHNRRASRLNMINQQLRSTDDSK